MNIKHLLEEHGVESLMLDDIVDGAASRLATNNNNDGISAQLRFLEMTCCWSEDQIMDAINEEGLLDSSSADSRSDGPTSKTISLCDFSGTDSNAISEIIHEKLDEMGVDPSSFSWSIEVDAILNNEE